MKANELRIGNYVYAFNNPVKVSIIEQFKGTNAINELNQDLFKPIPLTEEQMDKFSNLEKTDNGYFVFQDIQYYKISNDGSLYFDGVYTATDIKYIHQLQNLYFALTGEELKINIE